MGRIIINSGGPSTAWRTLLVSLAIIAACLVGLAACKDEQPPADPCRPTACTVPRPTPAADRPPVQAARCDERDGQGPCFYFDDPAGVLTWFYVADGHQSPDGATALARCPTEDGGPVPCLWWPWLHGNGQGTAQALVYGVAP